MPTESDYEMLHEEGDFDGDDLYITDDEDTAQEPEFDAEHQQELTEELAELEAEAQSQSSVNDLLRAVIAQASDGGTSTNATRRDGVISLSLNDLLLLFSGAGTTGVSGRQRGARRGRSGNDETEDEDHDEYGFGRSPHNYWPEVTEPQEKGVELLQGGEFGKLGAKTAQSNIAAHISRTLRNRSLKARPTSKEEIAGHLVPNSHGVAVASYDSNIYAGQFSADSSFYYTCCQDFRLHVYDMTAAPKPYRPGGQRINMPNPGHDTTLKVLKTIQGMEGNWTITDSHLSPDNERIIYSSINPTVYMASTLDSSPVQTPINFASRRDRDSFLGWQNRLAIWSCRFSADGNEIVAGGSAGGQGNIFVYDLLASARTVAIPAHEDDVNSCCWADTASGNVLISGSDDTFLKVWDRRSLGTSQKPAGALVGHTEGITFVSAKGDGRYVISNGKDHALRLWDLRNMTSSEEFETFSQKKYGIRGYDYRYENYSKPRFNAHPRDCSVMTYRGHTVFRTLIRCHFSPMETTGAQYLYSGSSDGRIHIWSLDGRVVEVLDRSHTLPMSYDPSEPEPRTQSTRRVGNVCVRDVSWHSKEPVVMSVGWGEARTGSTVARHEWKGLSKMHHNLEDYVEKRRAEKQERSSNHPPSHIPGSCEDEDDVA